MYILEELLFTIVFSIRLEKREISAKRGLAIAGIFAAFAGYLILITFLERLPGVNENAKNYGSPVSLISAFAICTGIFFMMVLLVYLARTVTLPEAFYAGTCAYAGEHIAYCVRCLCDSVVGGSLIDNFRHPLYWIINLAVAYVCYRFFARSMIIREHYSAPPTDTLRFLGVMILVILYLSVLSTAYHFQLLHAVYALVFCISILYYQTERQRALAREREALVREQLLVSRKAQYESYKENVDLFTLFGNMMDNAIEAVEKLPAEQRSIHLSVSEKLGMVLVREENPVAGDLIREDGRIATTKSDRENHGFGIRSMELVAEKYDGSLACRLEDGVFILTVTLPAA